MAIAKNTGSSLDTIVPALTRQDYAGSTPLPVAHRERSSEAHRALAEHRARSGGVVATKTDDEEIKGWQDLANCLGVDPDLFFPERGASTREAKEVCRGCTVRDECLEYALANREKFGIWGGLSERERRRIRKQRAAARRAERAGSVAVKASD